MAEGEGQVAGRLEVVVEATLATFKQRLKAKVEEASKGVTAKVSVELGDARGLRKALEDRVAAAATGVKARVGVELDDRDVLAFKAKLAAIADNTKAKVKLEVDGGKVAAEVVAEAKAAQKAAPSILVRLRAKAGLVKDVLAEKAKATLAARAGGGIQVPVTPKKGSAASFGKVFRLVKFTAIAGLVSLIEPAVGAIGQLVAGLTAMGSAAAPALGTLAAAPLAIGSFIQGMLAGKIAVQGLTQAFKLLSKQGGGGKLSPAEVQQLNKALKDLSPSQVAFVKNTIGLRGEWIKMRKQVAEPLFKPLAAEIKPLAHTVLPTLQKGLTGTTTIFGKLIQRTADWMETPLFNKQFAGIMGQNNRTIAAGGGAALNFAKGFVVLDRAAAPFQKRMDGLIGSVGRWFLATSRENARNGDFAAFLGRAADKAAQLWSITKNIGSGLGGVFSAAVPSGERLLTSFDQFTAHWAKWTHSTRGHNYLQDWFDKSEGGFREFAKMVDDTFKGVAKWATDPKIAGMIHQIRTELGPALSHLLKTLGQDVGSGFISALTGVIRTIDHMGPALTVLGKFTAAVGAALNGINDFADKAPGATDAVATLVGVLLTLRAASKGLSALKGLGGLLTGFGGGKGALGKGVLGGLGKGKVVPVYVTNWGGGPGGIGGGKGGTPAVLAGKTGTLIKGAGVVALVAALNHLGGKFDKWLDKNTNRQVKPGSDLEKSLLALARGGNFTGGLGGRYGSKSAVDWLKQIVGVPSSKQSFSSDIRNALGAQTKAGGFNTWLDKLTGRESGMSLAVKNIKQIDAALAHLDYKNPAAGQKAYNALLKKAGVDAKDFAKALPLSAAALKASADKAAAASKKLSDFRTVVARSGMSAKQFAAALKTLPAYVATKISTPGAVKTLKDVIGLQKQFSLTPKQLVTMIRTSGIKLNKAAITDLQKHYHLTPAQIKTLVDLQTAQALQRKKQIDQNYADLRKKYPWIKTEAQFLTSKAKNDTRSYKEYVNQQISSIRDKTVDIRLSAHAAKVLGLSNSPSSTDPLATHGRPAGGVRRAIGGPVTGPGSGTSDSIPAMLSNGEHVWTAKEVAKAGGQAAMYAMRRAVLAGKKVAAFASGGAVSVIPRVSGSRLDVSGINSVYARMAASLEGRLDAKLKRVVAAADAAAKAAAAGGGSNANFAGQGRVKAFLRSVDPLPYIWGGVGPAGYDCSGLVSAVINVMRGNPIHRRLFTTATMHPGVQGMKPGFGGVLNIGVSDVHTAGEYAGLRFEAANPRAGIRIGPSATPVSSFPYHMHLAKGGAVKSIKEQVAQFQKDSGVRVGGDPGAIEMPNGTVISLDGRRRPRGGKRFAGGGPVSGPGSGTSDSILARLSRGEYVMPANMTKKYRDLLDAMRAGALKIPGFAAGGGVISSVRTGVSSLTEYINDRAAIRRLTSGGNEKALLKRLDQLWNLGKRRLAVSERLTKAQTKLSTAMEGRNAIRSSFTANGTESGNVASIASANGGFLAPGFLIGELGRRAKDAVEFRRVLAALRKKGLGKVAYEQLATLGVEQGLPLAKQLLAASTSEIKQINTLQSQILATANATGSDSAQAYYNAGIQSARGLIAGLKKEQPALAKTAASLGSAMVKAIKKALHIKSPSRVMAGIGAYSVDGLTLGMESRRKQVVAKANSVAADIARGLTPGLNQLSGSSLHARTLQASSRSAAVGLGPAQAQGLAPLVGELHITGASPQEVKSGLDEAMFKLRLIRLGGVHADRTA